MSEGRQIVAHHPVDAFTLGEPLPVGSVSWVDEEKPERNRLIDYAFLHASLAGRVGKTWIDSDAQWFRPSSRLAGNELIRPGRSSRRIRIMPAPMSSG